jgi:DNA-binding MarR family transcriptional regulator
MQVSDKRLRVACETTNGLNPRERALVSGLINVPRALKQGIDAAMERAHGISLSEYDVLFGLLQRDDRQMRMSEVAEMVQLSLSGTSRLVERLERQGLVRREICPTDKRGFNAVLTDEGAAFAQEAQATHLETIRNQFLRHFTDEEQETLVRFWARLLGNGPEAPGT